MGKYIYCINKTTTLASTSGTSSYGQIGLGESPTEVLELSYQGLSAIISESPTKTYELSRKNLIGHQKVCEEVMKKGAILPVKFATVAESSDQILKKVLEAQYKELGGLLEEFSDKTELGLKVLWPNIEEVFISLMKENPLLQKEKEALAKKDPNKTYYERADFGQKVQKALKNKKEKLSKEVLLVLKKWILDKKELPLHGDKMILNQAFLICEKDQKDFDNTISSLTNDFKDLQFKYVGPLPPYNFIEVIIDLEKGEIKRSKRGDNQADTSAAESSPKLKASVG